MHDSTTLRLAALTLALALAAPAATASAQEMTFTQAPSRPFYVGGGVGVSAGFNGGAWFKLQEEVGYQFDPIYLGTVDLVMRVGGDFAQSFGDSTILQFDGRFTTSFGLWHNEDLGVRLAPSLALGAGVFVADRFCDAFGNCYGGTSAAFNIQFATQAELELLQGLLTIWFRPIAIDGFIADGSMGRWDILAGVDVHL